MRYRALVPLCLPTFLAALALSGCGSNLSSMSSSTPAGPAPAVAAMGVQTNGVAPNRWIYAQFNEPMNPATINRQTFTVADSGGKQVSGNVAYYPNYDIAGFQPSPALQDDAKYTITLSTGVVNAEGVHLASAYTDTLTTRAYADTSPITIKSVSPAPNATCVSATAPITITFSEGVDVSTVNSADITITGPNNEAIAAQISYDVATAVATLTPSAPLPSGNIMVKVQNVADAAGVRMPTTYGWEFATTCNQGGGATGKEYLYVGGGYTSAQFYGYAIDPATGNLTPVPGSPFPANGSATRGGCGGSSCVLTPLADPAGRFLFDDFAWGVAGRGFGTMAVAPTTGALSGDDVLALPSTDTYGVPASGISVDPEGRFIFGPVIASTSPTQTDWIRAVAVTSNGKLSFVPGEPFEFTGVSAFGAPAVTDQHVFVSGTTQGSTATSYGVRTTYLDGFSIDQTNGTLSAVSKTKIGVGGGQQVITPSGKFLYSYQTYTPSNGVDSLQIAGYQVNTDGSLTPLSQPSQQTPDQPAAVLIMSPNGNFLYHVGIDYAAGNKLEIRAYAINQNTGSLSLTAVYTNIRAVGGFQPIAIDPAAKYVYIPESNASTGAITLAGFTVNPTNGALTPISGVQVPFPARPTGMAIVRPQ